MISSFAFLAIISIALIQIKSAASEDLTSSEFIGERRRIVKRYNYGILDGKRNPFVDYNDEHDDHHNKHKQEDRVNDHHNHHGESDHHHKKDENHHHHDEPDHHHDSGDKNTHVHDNINIHIEHPTHNGEHGKHDDHNKNEKTETKPGLWGKLKEKAENAKKKIKKFGDAIGTALHIVSKD